MKNILSVDLEDWYHAFSTIPVKDWGRFEPRIHIGTEKLLSLFAKRDIAATFFVLGDVAERSPDLIRRIADGGHEIACHGQCHGLIYQQTRKEFRKDVARSIEAIGPLADSEIQGFRAPWWSVTEKSLWALDILAEMGFRYDSSIFPARTGYYGISNSPRFIHERETEGGRKLTEVPPLTRRIVAKTFPAGGGFYLRTLPYRYNSKAIRLFNDDGHPAVVYLHPWELDREQPNVRAPFMQRLIHYTALNLMEAKFTRLLDEFEFGPVRDAVSRLAEADRSSAP